MRNHRRHGECAWCEVGRREAATCRSYAEDVRERVVDCGRTSSTATRAMRDDLRAFVESDWGAVARRRGRIGRRAFAATTGGLEGSSGSQGREAPGVTRTRARARIRGSLRLRQAELCGRCVLSPLNCCTSAQTVDRAIARSCDGTLNRRGLYFPAGAGAFVPPAGAELCGAGVTGVDVLPDPVVPLAGAAGVVPLF